MSYRSWAVALLVVVLVAASSGGFVDRAQEPVQFGPVHKIASGGWGRNRFVINPDVKVLGNTAYVAYANNYPGGDIIVAKVENATSPQVQITPVAVAQTQGPSIEPSLAAKGNKLCVAWQEGIAGTNWDIWVSCSNDGAQTWSQPVNVSNNDTASGWITLFTGDDWAGNLWIEMSKDGQNIYVVWSELEDEKMFLSVSNDGGRSFSAPQELKSNEILPRFPFLKLLDAEDTPAAFKDKLLLAWADGMNDFGDIYVSFSADGGKTFSDPVKATDNPGFSDAVECAVSGDSLLCVNDDTTTNPDNADINLTVSTDGKSWSGTRAILKDGAFPTIGSKGRNVYVAAENIADGGTGVILTYSTDAGKTFAPRLVIPNTTGPFDEPQMAIGDDGTVYIVSVGGVSRQSTEIQLVTFKVRQ
ncbi:MAG: glycoside hydrolase [Candidatus Bipolaricaulota bacterium]|nr:glycoside hydrolase [Candidatus Bipolaricaulota bacterium]MCS7274876.1 glycoside hydrolase [Candidatus Bipolaricaulota bacterium]MDW8111155.1 sialidase family protein [Candidatus Bipolaricaulota bacterium]MDW8329585.1 sialidase family protein [Candidatus Bipolaricaulota bacterium]